MQQEQYIRIDKNGDKHYYKNKAMTILHREDGHAVEYADGSKYWYINGKQHRMDGPAVESEDGHKEWWINGKLHREDGHAVEYADGSKVWHLNDKLHRDDGPAAEWADGSKGWYINGKYLTEEQFNQRTNPVFELKKLPVDKLKRINEYSQEERLSILYSVCHQIYIARNISCNQSSILENLSKIDSLFCNSPEDGN